MADQDFSSQPPDSTPPASPPGGTPGGLNGDDAPGAGPGADASEPIRPASAGGLFQMRYREVTVSAIVFAILIGIVMNAAITYAGLKIGFTIGGSAIAAVLGFGVLRGIMRKGSILETNIAQTIASAVNTSNSGVIFTVPVLFLIGYELTLGGRNFWLITIACIAGAMLGTAFIIPLRKQMIDIERLRFPSPTGVATILKSPGAGPAKAVVLLLGCLLGALIYLPAGMPSITYETPTDQLDDLFERGKITHEQRVRTRRIATWIEQEDAPDPLIERGRLLSELNEAERRYQQLSRERLLHEGPAGRQLDRLQRATAAAEAVEEIEQRLAEYKQTEQTQPESVGWPADAQPDLYSDELAEAIYRISREESDWPALRDRQLGWAAQGLPGYSDLDWRLPAEEADDAEPQDFDGDGEPEPALTRRADRDRDGRADLILTDNTIDLGRLLDIPGEYQLVFAIAPFALGAGYITGKAGLFVLAGGILAFFILNPLAYNLGWMPETVLADQAPDYGFNAFNRPLGIGLLLGGALMGVVFSLPAIREAVKSIAAASRIKGSSDELGLKTLIVAVVAAAIFLFIAADSAGNLPINVNNCPVTNERISEDVEPAQYKGYAIGFATTEASVEWQQWDESQRDAFLDEQDARPGWLSGLNSHLRAALIALIGAIWIWFAGIIIAQCAGMTDWSPISGLALLTVVLVLLLAGTGAVVGAVLLGAALCVAITLAADMMGDMKTGYLVGSVPKRQQIVELAVVWIGPIVCMLTLLIIVQVNLAKDGIPIGPGTDTVAPQAQALQAVVTGVQGGEMPYMLYGLGAALGALLGLGAFPGLGVLVGLSMYLPFYYIATYGVGCLINMFMQKVKGKAWSEAWGVPFAAGLIVGESLLALTINIVVLARG